MFTHPDTVCERAHLDHQDRLRAAARERLTAQAVTGGPSRRARATRAVLGSALVAAGRRLGGGPVPVLGPVAAGERSAA